MYLPVDALYIYVMMIFILASLLLLFLCFYKYERHALFYMV